MKRVDSKLKGPQGNLLRGLLHFLWVTLHSYNSVTQKLAQEHHQTLFQPIKTGLVIYVTQAERGSVPRNPKNETWGNLWASKSHFLYVVISVVTDMSIIDVSLFCPVFYLCTITVCFYSIALTKYFSKETFLPSSYSTKTIYRLVNLHCNREGITILLC